MWLAFAVFMEAIPLYYLLIKHTSNTTQALF